MTAPVNAGREPPIGADVVALTQWLCEIPSPIGEERALCELLLKRSEKWRAAGPTVRVLESIAVPLTRGTGGPRIALVGHTDTVRTQHDGPVRIEGDRLYGAGSADMKSGLALMIAAAEDTTLTARADLTLIFYAREEGPYAENELGPLLEAHPDVARQDLAICLEPSYSKLQLGCMGSMHAKVTLRGRTAHSARPWEGDNAMYKAWPILKDLEARAPVDATIDGLPYRSVMSATMAQGGRGRNIVPDAFEINVNYRFLPGVTLEQAEADVRALVADRADVEFTDRSPSAPPHRSHPLVARLVDAGAKAVESKQAWTDVARFAQLGVAAVNWGPGDQQQAHQRNEFTSVAGLHEGWRILRAFLSSL
ncbi:MAG: succinyl-diaminopimelate desuccinylase [Polyangiales bacterium]